MKYFIDTNIIIDGLDKKEEAKEKLSFFRKVDIKPKIYEEAIQFSRYCHSKGIKLKGKCEAIDFLHFMTAKYYKLVIVSNDRDLEKLERSYDTFMRLKEEQK